MRLPRPRVIVAIVVAGLTLAGLAACTPAAPIKADPISQPHAGYVMYPNVGKTYQQVHAYLPVPSFICLPKQTSTVRWFIAMDGIAGATNLDASARAGLILGCRNGSPSYIPYYGIYEAGQNTPDKAFAPVRINQGDEVLFAVGQGFGQVEFQMLVTATPGAPKRPVYHADIFVPTSHITGTAVGCLLDATSGAPSLPKTTSFPVYSCSAYTDLAGNGVFGAPNHGSQATRLYNISSKSGRQLTRLHTLDIDGLDGYFEIVER
jgi:hypothetical protein